MENSDIVFVGYGIVAPEYGWNDYKDVDVRGKTLLMLINDPPIPDPNDPTKLDEKMFGGRAMTYYGRWTYKYEIAAQKGAAAAIIIHETEAGGVSVFGRAHELVEGKFRTRCAGQERECGFGAFLDYARCREEIAR